MSCTTDGATSVGTYAFSLRASNADGEDVLALTLAVLPTAVAVPTLGQWALMLLGLAAAGLGARRLRPR